VSKTESLDLLLLTFLIQEECKWSELSFSGKEVLIKRILRVISRYDIRIKEEDILDRLNKLAFLSQV